MRKTIARPLCAGTRSRLLLGLPVPGQPQLLGALAGGELGGDDVPILLRALADRSGGQGGPRQVQPEIGLLQGGSDASPLSIQDADIVLLDGIAVFGLFG